MRYIIAPIGLVLVIGFWCVALPFLVTLLVVGIASGNLFAGALFACAVAWKGAKVTLVLAIITVMCVAFDRR